MTSNVDQDVEVCHSLRGRLRVRVIALNHSRRRAYALEQRLSKVRDVRSVEARPVTNSVVLVYESLTTDPERLLSEIRSAARELPELLKVTPAEPFLETKRDPRAATQARPLTGFAKVAALSGFLLLHLMKSWVFRAPHSPKVMVLAAIVSSVPLVFRALKDLSRGKLIGLDSFLAAATGTAIALGETTTALEIIYIREIGELLESYVADKSQRSIRETVQVMSGSTFILVDGTEVEVSTDKIAPGDTVVTRAGERICVDGSVIKGDALVDESHITGHPGPEHRKPGDAVFAGTIVQQGILFIRAEKVGDETYLSRVVHIVESSLANRAPVETRADVLAERLTRLGLLLTTGTLLITGDMSRTFAALLLMSCPCATSLAASTAVTAALTNAARNRVLVKGGLYLEKLGEIDCFCFDKTGTLTSDRPDVAEIVTRSPWIEPSRVLALAAVAESHNQHPIARAIVGAASQVGESPPHVGLAEIVVGKGVRASLDHQKVTVGNAAFMQEEGVDVRYFTRAVERFEQVGYTTVFVARDGKAQGIIGLSYAARQTVPGVLRHLRDEGAGKFHLLSGDSEKVVQNMSGELGFEGHGAHLLPEDKVRYIQGLQDSGCNVAMVGDGINDAAALSHAQLGIAVAAGGAEAAIDAADIALVDGDLERIVFVRKLSRQTLRVIEQNHWFAVATNVLGIVFAFTGRLTPVMSGALHLVHSLGILANSSRLMKWSPSKIESVVEAVEELGEGVEELEE